MSEIRPDEIKQAFALFDTQNTGKIEPRVFQDFLNASTMSTSAHICSTLGDEELKSTIRIPTHALDIKEFTSLVNQYNEDEHKDPEEPYRRAFQSINRDGSGNVSTQELKAAMDSFLGPDVLSEADVDEIITEGDVSGDGRVTLEEFLKVLHKSEKRHRGEHVL
ncbi:Calcium-binding protein 7 [Mortierella sp. AM989]|nr:Calcium-binding protein 7 [Mortierella sp. AM989]